MGGFHTLSCFIAAIGKLWGDGGLRDLLVDSSVYAAATVDQMLCGKQFNRAVRGLTLVYEALCSLWFGAFFRWLNDKIEKFPENTLTLFSTFMSMFQAGKTVEAKHLC
ncbi:Hypothetical predicted protein [Mytilus galloprovincialis]|uniref:Uncharacterized protein n=1 Tax=Mytilus galloprovincialis TaxID=29158 RepID=A0A8B6DZE0_MYTGA|nr:Hypothetical predicted protein [Mytilus galloprovincialis]